MTGDIGRSPTGRASAASQSNPQAVSSIAAIPSAATISKMETVRPADATALSYWFPLIEASGLPVPKTVILPMPAEAIADAWEIFDNKEPSGAVDAFAGELKAAAAEYGTPFFLRTDHTSGKHDWKDACFVADPNKIASHVLQIAYFSEMHMIEWGGNWVVREFLPTISNGVCPRFGDMPVCKEFRFFVDGGNIECVHPYWPRHALEQGGFAISDDDYAALCSMPDEALLHRLASDAGKAVGGRWSVDLLETERGWFLTDMAEAHKSFHWEECPAKAMSARQGQDAQQLGVKPASAVAESDLPDSPLHPTTKDKDQ